MDSQVENISTIKDIDLANKDAWKIARSQPNEAYRLANEALNSAKNLDYELGIGEAYSTLAASKLWLSEYNDALDYSIEAEKIFDDLEEFDLLGRVNYTMGTIFFYLSDFNNAQKGYLDALQNYFDAENEIGKADAYNGIGSVYYAIGQNHKALDYLTKSKVICEATEAYSILQKVLDGLGQAYINLGEYEQAITTLHECLDVINKHEGSLHVKAHCYNKLGSVYLLQEKTEKALDYFAKSLSLREDAQFKTGEATCLLNIGKVHLKLKSFSEAEEYFNKALDLAKNVKSIDIESKTVLQLSELNEHFGNNDKALSLYKEYHNLRESIKNENIDKKTKGLELKFKIEQEKSEKSMLQIQNGKLTKYSDDLVALADIGKSLTSLLSAEKIIKKAHEKVSKIMDAESFGLGIYQEDKNQIYFPGYIEYGESLQDFSYDLDGENERLAKKCFVDNVEIIIQDFDNEHHKWIKTHIEPKAGKSTASIIYIPFSIPNRSSGVITVQSFQKNAYNEHHVNMVRNLAVYMGIALDNAILYQNLEQKIENRTKKIVAQKEKLEKSFHTTSLLNQIGQQLTSSTDFESIFLKLHKNVGQLMDASVFSVRLYNQEKGEIDYKFQIEKGVVLQETFTVPMTDTDNYSVICIANKQTIHINDNKEEYKKYTNEIIVPSGEMPDSLIFYPMVIGERVTGLITVQSFQTNAYSTEHVEILKTLASFTAIALENVNILEHLEDKIAERTDEVVQKKEEIEKTYRNAELLKEIGRKIISSLSTTEVIDSIYQSTNQLMDTPIIGIGLVHKRINKVVIKGAIENGTVLPDFSYDLDKLDSLTSLCVNRSQEIFISDYTKEIGLYKTIVPNLKVGERPESIIYIPLIVKEKVLGIISVQSFQKNAYSNYHLNILRNLALYAATAIENSGLYANMERTVEKRTSEVVAQKEEIEKTYNNTKLLSQIGQNIISTHSLKSIFEQMYKNVNRLMDATTFSIRICNYEENIINYKYSIEKGKRLPESQVSLDDIDNYSVWCVKNKKDIFINDHQKEYSKYTNNIVVVSGELPDSLLFCPLIVKGNVIGVVSAQSFEKNAYTQYHLDILRTLGTYLAIALENAHILENLEDKVDERTREVVQQKEIIEEKNKDITDSIRYAQRIQNVILPSLRKFDSTFKSSFVYYKPRDIVSGDFYWLEKLDDKIYVAAVDCTGHGVPGALVSIVGANSLNRCVNEFNLRKPAEILNQLRDLVTDTFANTKNDVKDGMDMALCCIDLKNLTLEYAGAYNPIWIVRDISKGQLIYDTSEYKSLQLIEIKGDKQPIGHYDNSGPFTNHKIELFSNDRIYLFSDGFADQFGGSNIRTIKRGGKKFRNSNLKKFIIDLQNVKMEDQEMHFSNTFEEWKGDFEQVDDVCIIGIEI